MTAGPARRCEHWHGDHATYCGATGSVRRFLTGHKCPAHTPAAIAGRPEPVPGPGWPAHHPAIPDTNSQKDHTS